MSLQASLEHTIWQDNQNSHLNWFISYRIKSRLLPDELWGAIKQNLSNETHLCVVVCMAPLRCPFQRRRWEAGLARPSANGMRVGPDFWTNREGAPVAGVSNAVISQRHLWPFSAKKLNLNTAADIWSLLALLTSADVDRLRSFPPHCHPLLHTCNFVFAPSFILLSGTNCSYTCYLECRLLSWLMSSPRRHRFSKSLVPEAH